MCCGEYSNSMCVESFHVFGSRFSEGVSIASQGFERYVCQDVKHVSYLNENLRLYWV
jgi:hypothetical protein